MPEESWTPQRVNAWANAYWSSCTLHAAVRLGLTGELARGAATADDLARRLELNARGLGMLLTALTALGLLYKEGDIYAMDPQTAPLFTPGGPRDMSSIILHNANMAADWTELHQSIKSGKPRPGDWSEEEKEDFYKGMRDVSRQQAPGLAARLGLKSGQHLLDLGGGPGVYGYTFARETPGLQVTVLDLPASETSFLQEGKGLDPAVKVARINGDYRTIDIEGPYDVIWISHVLHGEGPQEAATLLEKAARTLRPGGVLWIQEFLVDSDGGGHPFPALFALNMLLHTKKGQAYALQELSGFMEQAGLTNISLEGPSVPGGPAWLIKGVKPS